MGDARTVKDLQFALEEIKGPVKLSLDGSIVTSRCRPQDEQVQQSSVSSTQESNEPPVDSLDRMTRWLNLCRNIPCMGVILGFTAALFFGIASLTVKFIRVNPLVTVIFQ